MSDTALKAQLLARQPHILVVDDDVHILTGLQDILKDEGYSVTVAQTGGEAVEHVKQETFCVAVIDYSLPDSNGIELSRTIQTLHGCSQIIVMTGHDRVDMGKSVDRAGPLAAFLRKPVEVDTILREIATCVARECERLGVEGFNLSERRQAPLAPAPIAFESGALIAMKPPTSADVVISRWLLIAGTLAVFLVGAASDAFFRRSRVVPPAALIAASPPVDVSLPKLMRDPPASVPRPSPPAPSPVPTRGLPLVDRPDRMETRKKLASVSKKSLNTEPVKTSAAKPAAMKDEHLERRLTSDDAWIRLRAAKALLLQRPGNPEALGVLQAAFNESGNDLRLGAIEAARVTKAAAPCVVAGLARAMREPSNEISNAAAAALVHLGVAAVPSLIDLLATADTRSLAIAALTAIGPAASAALPALNALENDPDAGVAVMKALAQIDVDPANSASAPTSSRAPAPK